MLAELSPYVCDICRKRRDKDANHWYVLTCLDNGTLEINTWGPAAAEILDATHACGQEHALNLASRWMTYGNFNEVQEASRAAKS